MRRKLGLSIEREVADDLESLAFTLGTTMSDVVKDGVQLKKANLPPDARERFESVRRARRAG